MANTELHAQEAFSRISHRMESVTTVHDYGCRDGQGTVWLASVYSSVVGYDIDLSKTHHISGHSFVHGDVCDPQSDADVIYVGHVLEAGAFDSHITNIPATIAGLKARCRYLVLGIHTEDKHTSFMGDMLAADDCIHHEKYPCHLQKHDSVTLVEGDLL